MQFKHPELLYALFLLLIPIIVHLFQLRKFKKEAFTNVAFLKTVALQTRKSSQIKKWLTLLTRLLLLGCIILAFTQPFTSKKLDVATPKETVIYLDNSFSMQQKGPQGELLKRAVQDLISNADYEIPISLITNNKVYKNTTIKAIKNDLLQLTYSEKSLSYKSALLKCKTLFRKQTTAKKQIIFISDFQQQNAVFAPDTDSLTTITLVPLKPVNANNTAIDSVYYGTTTATNSELKVRLRNFGSPVENLSLALYNDDKLMAKSAVSITDEAETTFTINKNQALNGILTIEDSGLSFDNTLYFNINSPSKINVLSITEGDDTFLKKIYTNTEFNFTSTESNTLNYNVVNQQHTIILNELKSIPSTLVNVLNTFIQEGGNVVVIPSKDSNMESYNRFLSMYNTEFNSAVDSEKLITTINYSHPLYKNDVFEKQVKNFQYPKVNSFYPVSKNKGNTILNFEDNNPFLTQIQSQLFVFTAPINKQDSNFKNWALVVPTFYKIGVQSLKHPKLFYTIGEKQTFDVDVSLKQDDIVSIENESEKFIPQQQYFNNKVSIITESKPEKSGIYHVTNRDSILKNISYNYNRNESILVYDDPANIKNVTITNSIPSLFDTLKSNTKVNELWKWFLIFALAFLIIEMLILKYFK